MNYLHFSTIETHYHMCFMSNFHPLYTSEKNKNIRMNVYVKISSKYKKS